FFFLLVGERLVEPFDRRLSGALGGRSGLHDRRGEQRQAGGDRGGAAHRFQKVPAAEVEIARLAVRAHVLLPLHAYLPWCKKLRHKRGTSACGRRSWCIVVTLTPLPNQRQQEVAAIC